MKDWTISVLVLERWSISTKIWMIDGEPYKALSEANRMLDWAAGGGHDRCGMHSKWCNKCRKWKAAADKV